MKAVVVSFVLFQVWQLLLLPLPLYRFCAERISDRSSTIFLAGVRINRPVCSHLRRNLFSCRVSSSSTWTPQHPPAFPASSPMLEDAVRLFALQLPLCLCLNSLSSLPAPSALSLPPAAAPNAATRCGACGVMISSPANPLLLRTAAMNAKGLPVLRRHSHKMTPKYLTDYIGNL